MVRNFAVAIGRKCRPAALGEKDGRSPMSENKRDYEVGRGKPVRSRFKKGQPGNPRGPRPEAGITAQYRRLMGEDQRFRGVDEEN